MFKKIVYYYKLLLLIHLLLVHRRIQNQTLVHAETKQQHLMKSNTYKRQQQNICL